MTQITAIPTVARASVRAFVKGRPEWFPWIVAKGKRSNEALNADLLDFASEHGLMDDVRKLIDAAEAGLPASAQTDCYETTTSPAAINASAGAEANAAFDAGAILAGVEQFLSPLVKSELEKALAPVVAAANKPATEKVVTVTVPALPALPAGALPYATKTGSESFNMVFRTKVTEPYGKRPITLWDSFGAAPAIDPFYVIDPETMGFFATAAERGTNVWLVGPTGSGKTSLPEQFAAYTGRPFTKIGFTRQTDVGELVGGKGFEAGKTQWEDGALIAAMRRPGNVILFDEITISPAGIQAIVQGMSDEHRTFTIPATGEVVTCAPGIMLCVADNTNGSGDETGRYAGTNQANTALVNRFGRMLRVDYMPRKQEVQALRNHTGIGEDAAKYVVDFFALARRLPDMEGAGLSLRQMVGFVGTVLDGFSSKKAMEVAVLNKLPSTERAAIEALATLDWNRDADSLLAGKGVSSMPSQSAGARAFDDDVSASMNR